MAACSGGSGSSSGDGGSSGATSSSLLSSSSSSLLALYVGNVIPLFVPRCSFRRPPLTCLQCATVGCCLRLSAVLFVCVAGRRPLAQLIALVLPAAGPFIAHRSSKASLAWPSRRHCHC
jgi:hypothetical protein